MDANFLFVAHRGVGGLKKVKEKEYDERMAQETDG
jgi:hypothetical protein